MIKPSIPDEFAQRMRLQLGNELSAFLCALDEAPLRGIRMNPLKETTAAYPYMQAEPIPWAEKAWYLPEESQAGATVIHAAGAFYIQEPAAMIPAAVLNARPGEKILDLCAAPGGKTTQIGCAMRGEGILVCNEPVPKRAWILSGNIERIGIPNAIVTCEQPAKLADRWPEGFDAVLVDAPCSGEGMFRRDPDTRKEWTKEKAQGCAVRQREILTAAAELVRPGGRIVYSTCTYNPEENEEIIHWFMEKFSDFYPEVFSLPGVEAPSGMYTCYPHQNKGEGQFAALLRKAGNQTAFLPADHSMPVPSKSERTAFEKAFPSFPFATHLFGKTLVSMPELPDIKGIRTFRIGLHLGEVRNGSVIPDHASALCFQVPEVQMLDMTSDEAVKYMAGETINRDAEGWIVLRYGGLVTGWGKGSGGIIKNHYPKGLRNGHLIP